ncbi:MAG: formylmethanofuran dehydrogenase subunit C [Promethearchaeota archaeon]
MTVTLKLKKKPELELEADCISPDNFAGKKIGEIKKLPVYLGNREQVLEDYFEISGKPGDNPEDTEIVIEGDCSLVKRIGEKMSAGNIVIKGNCGMHVGNYMTGGKILVEGNADAWAGAMMDGGELEIKGDAGDHCASAYRGFWVGVNNGHIIVHGRVGVESGSWMRVTKTRNKFPIFECGSADLYLGLHNHGGTIICHGDVEGRVGADMSHGQIIIKGKVKEMLPSFKKIGDIDKITTPAGEITGNFEEYAGDYAISPKPRGRLYLAK